jgi:hypothetical protein
MPVEHFGYFGGTLGTLDVKIKISKWRSFTSIKSTYFWVLWM